VVAETQRADDAAAELAERGTAAETSARLAAARRDGANAAADAKAARREAAAAREMADLIRVELEAARVALHANREADAGARRDANSGGNNRADGGGDGGGGGGGGGDSFFGRLTGGWGGSGGSDAGMDSVRVDGRSSSEDGPSTHAVSFPFPFPSGGSGGGGDLEASNALLLEEASRLKSQVEAADEARGDVAKQLSQAAKEKLEALVELAQEGERRRRDAATIEQLQRQCAVLCKKVDSLVAGTKKTGMGVAGDGRRGGGSGGGVTRAEGGGGGGDGGNMLAAGAGVSGDSNQSGGGGGGGGFQSPGTPTRSAHGVTTPVSVRSRSLMGRMFGGRDLWNEGASGSGMESGSTSGSSARGLSPAEAEQRIAVLAAEVAEVTGELDRIGRIAQSAAALRSRLIASDALADIVAATDADYTEVEEQSEEGSEKGEGGREERTATTFTSRGAARSDGTRGTGKVGGGAAGQGGEKGTLSVCVPGDGDTGTFAVESATATLAAAAARRRGDTIERAGLVAEEARLLRLALGSTSTTSTICANDHHNSSSSNGGGGGGGGGGSSAASEGGSSRVAQIPASPAAAAAAASCVEMSELAYLAARLQERCGRTERELAKLTAKLTATAKAKATGDNSPIGASLSPGPIPRPRPKKR